jgi:hypothetical protein
MTAATEPKEKRKAERGQAPFLMVLLGAGLTELLSKGGFLSEAKAFVLSWTIAFGVYYWLPPRPAGGLLRWLLKSSIVVVAVCVIFFRMPTWLEGKMPLLYYGIPIVTIVILFIVVIWTNFFSSWRRA